MMFCIYTQLDLKHEHVPEQRPQKYKRDSTQSLQALNTSHGGSGKLPRGHKHMQVGAVEFHIGNRGND